MSSKIHGTSGDIYINEVKIGSLSTIKFIDSQIGDFVLALNTDNTVHTYGSIVVGTSLVPASLTTLLDINASFDIITSNALTGNWKCLGLTSTRSVTLYQRIS